MSQLTSVKIALCADRNIQVGLHVTLYSLLSHAQTHVEIYLLHKSYTDKELSLIGKTLLPFKSKYKLKIINFDAEILNHFQVCMDAHLLMQDFSLVICLM